MESMPKYTDTEKFAKWLKGVLEDRGIRPSKLADDAGVARSTITRLLKGEIYPTDDTYSKIAKALGEPPDKILRLANRLPAINEPDALEQDLLNRFRSLPRQEQRFIIQILNNLHGRNTPDMAVAEPKQDGRGQEILSEEPSLTPTDEHIMDIFKNLNNFWRTMVYNFARWALGEQLNPANSTGRRQPSPEKLAEWQRDLENIEVMIATHEATPERRKAVMVWMREFLYRLEAQESAKVKAEGENRPAIN